MKLYLTITGGAAGVMNFTAGGGVSSWFEGAQVPYGTKSTLSFLKSELGSTGIHGGKFCSKRAASHLATAGFQSLLDVGSENEKLISISSTSSLYTENQRDDRKNKGYISVLISEDGKIENIQEILISVTFKNALEFKDILRRSQDGLLVSILDDIIQSVAFDNSSIKDNNATPTSICEKIERYKTDFWIENVSIEKFQYKEYPSGDTEEAGIFSGSFNPLHDGHIAMANSYKKAYPNNKIYFNIAKSHLFKDKLLSPYEIYHRGKDIRSLGFQVVSSNSGIFNRVRGEFGKSVKHFIMGRDTFDRISEEDLLNLKEANTKIFLFERKSKKELDFVDELSYSQPTIPNISSTEIRKNEIQK